MMTVSGGHGWDFVCICSIELTVHAHDEMWRLFSRTHGDSVNARATKSLQAHWKTVAPDLDSTPTWSVSQEKLAYIPPAVRPIVSFSAGVSAGSVVGAKYGCTRFVLDPPA